MIDPDKMRAFAESVVRDLNSAGFQALWAGGCVRDQLRSQPPKDYDVATNATPDQVREVFGHQRTIAVGAAFGVITVIGSKSTGNIEVATFRADATYSDGRHPDSVRFTDAKEDALRRDFTINGMFYDPIEEEYIDFVGGEEDLALKMIRAIGDPLKRIEEDRLRMLRAVRFASTFGYEIDPATFHAVQENAEALNVVSRERILVELALILTDANRTQGMKLLDESGLLPHVISGLADDCTQSESWATLLVALDKVTESPLEASLALIWRFVGEQNNVTNDLKQLESIQREMKLSNDSIKTINWILRSASSILNASNEYWPEIHEIIVHEKINVLINVCAAIAENDEQLEHISFCQNAINQPPDQLNPEPLLDGNSILEHQLAAGKEIGKLLKMVRDAQLLGEISSSSEAISFARSLIANGQIS